MRAPHLLICLLIACELASQSFPPSIRFRHINADGGLSQNAVTAVLQDSKGFMWLAVGNGLERYDGYNFVRFEGKEEDSSSIYPSLISGLVEDRNGFIWISHRGKEGCVEKFDPHTGKVKRFRHVKGDPASLAHNDVRVMCMDKGGMIWIGTGHGISRLDPATGKFRTFQVEEKPGSSDDAIWALCPSGQGGLWVGRYWASGLAYFDTEKFRYEKNLGAKSEESGKKGFFYVTGIQEDGDGRLWIATRSGLFHFDPVANTTKTFQHDPSDPGTIVSNDLWSHMHLDSRGNLWVGSMNQGLSLLKKNAARFIPVKQNGLVPWSLSDNTVKYIYEDRSGLIWIATFNGGLNIYNPGTERFELLQNIPGDEGSFSGHEVSAFCLDKKGRIWLGKYGDGIDVYDPVTGIFERYRHEPGKKSSLHGNAVNAIVVDSAGVIWVSAYGIGVAWFDEKIREFVHFTGNWTSDLLIDTENRLWIAGHGNPLVMADPVSKKIIREFAYDDKDSTSVPSVNMSGIFCLQDGSVWVQSGPITAVVDTSSWRFRVFRKRKESGWIGNYHPFTITKAQNGDIVFGSTSGLCFFDPVTFRLKKKIGKEHGLQDENVVSVQEVSPGTFWTGTNRGIAMIRVDEGVVRSYGLPDGIPANEFGIGSGVMKDGSLLFASYNGLLKLQPRDFSESSSKPGIVLTSFTVINKPYPLPTDISSVKEILLSHRDYFFTLEFAVTDYLDPAANRYRYRLAGFNEETVELGSRHDVTFTNLDPGEYTLYLSGCNRAGVWSDEIAMRISISPPFYRTWWFYTLSVISGILLIWLYIRIRTASLLEAKTVLENRVRERTAELNDRNVQLSAAYKDITDSIHYASRIQEAMLPPREQKSELFPDSFILYLPRDVVSGDFYWYTRNDDCRLIAAVDCTGHGVPGAFMSMIGNAFLDQIVNEHGITSPARILDQLREMIIKALKQNEEELRKPGESDLKSSVQDGMDISLLCINDSKKEILFAGANNPLWIFRESGGQVHCTEIPGDKQPIGRFRGTPRPFGEHRIQVEEGMICYFFTDGFADQFGGPKGKKIKYKNLKEILIRNSSLPFPQQEEHLMRSFEEWKGNFEQVDDVLVIGLRP